MLLKKAEIYVAEDYSYVRINYTVKNTSKVRYKTIFRINYIVKNTSKVRRKIISINATVF